MKIDLLIRQLNDSCFKRFLQVLPRGEKWYLPAPEVVELSLQVGRNWVFRGLRDWSVWRRFKNLQVWNFDSFKELSQWSGEQEGGNVECWALVKDFDGKLWARHDCGNWQELSCMKTFFLPSIPRFSPFSSLETSSNPSSLAFHFVLKPSFYFYRQLGLSFHPERWRQPWKGQGDLESPSLSDTRNLQLCSQGLQLFLLFPHRVTIFWLKFSLLPLIRQF